MIARELRGRAFYALAGIAILLLSLAYQIKTPFTIDVGATDDGAFLDNFYDRESADGLSYRWSSDSSSIVFPGIGGYAPALLQLRLNGYRPPELPRPTVSIRANGHEVASFPATGEFETYELTIGRDVVGTSGTLLVELRSETFVPHESSGTGDQRLLGVLLDHVSLQFRRDLHTVVFPAPLPTVYMTAGVLVSYLLARRFLSKRWALVASLGILVGLALALVAERVQVTPHCPWVLVAPGAGLLVMEMARRTTQTKTNLLLYTMGVAAILLGLWRFATVAQLSWMGVAPDLANNYHTATILRSGGAIYDVHSPLFTGYDNPPLTAILHMPLTLLGFRNAVRLFFVVNTLFVATSVALVFITRKEYLLTYPYWMIAVALVLNLDPVLDSLLLGQLDALLLLLIVISFCAYRHGRDLIAGSPLGLAAMIKFSPLLLAMYFLLKRQMRVFAATVAAILAAGTLSLLAAGFDAHWVFITDTLPTLLAGSAQMENQSLNGFFNRLFLDGEFITGLMAAPPLPQARFLTLASSILIVGVTFYLLRRRLASRTDLRFDLEFSLVVITLPLISSIAWHHYQTWYVLPLLVLLNPKLGDGLPKRARRTVTALFALCFLILSIPVTAYAPSFLEGPAKLMISMRLYSGLALFALFAYLLTQHRAEPSSKEFEGGSPLETEGPGDQVREDASPSARPKSGCQSTDGISVTRYVDH